MRKDVAEVAEEPKEEARCDSAAFPVPTEDDVIALVDECLEDARRHNLRR